MNNEKFVNDVGVGVIKNYVDSKISKSPFVVEYGSATYSELSNALSNNKAVIIKNVPHENDTIDMLVNWHSITTSQIEIEGVTTASNTMWDIDITITNDDVWSVGFVSQDPFMLLDFQQQLNLTIPSCQTDVSNTSIPNVDIVISETLGKDWAIASLAKYEVYDATSGGNRINCWPVCSFSMNTQKTLRVRMMCAGPNSKTAKRIAGAILLKHR